MARLKGKASLELGQAILAIVEERAPISVRGIAYQLGTQRLIPSLATKHTARVSRITTEMRDRGLRDPECKKPTGLKKNTRYKLEAEGQIPLWRRITERLSGYSDLEVQAWIDKRFTNSVLRAV